VAIPTVDWTVIALALCTTVALAGMVLPFGAGWALTRALGHGSLAAIFVGASLTATSSAAPGKASLTAASSSPSMPISRMVAIAAARSAPSQASSRTLPAPKQRSPKLKRP
jgi:hypothetical protein